MLKHSHKIFFDLLLVFTIIGLGFFGLVAVFNASSVAAFRDFGNPYHFIQDQGVFLIAGFIIMSVVSFIDYHIWYRLAVPMLLGVFVLLLAVFIPGIGVHALGAKRWINFGFFTLQPTELAKLVLVVYLSAWFSYSEKGRLLPFLVLLGILLGLIILQPDMGTAIIILLIAVALYFISGAPFLHFMGLIPVLVVSFIGLAIISPYRLARITTFLNHNSDPLGSSYHVRQILIGLGSGGWFGVGLGKSRQKYAYLPEASTDSIFAIIAEEVGFVGTLLFIFFLIFIISRIFTIARYAPDRLGQLLAYGVGIWFGIQVLINLAAMVALVPLTGVPLPLISYGGSSLLSLLTGFGIVLNISRSMVGRHK